MALHCIELPDLLACQHGAAGLDLSSRRRVLTDLAGTHLSGFRGRGMEFEEHRRYVPGDEIRSIDWRVTARTGQTHVRSYREERERPVIIALDCRRPMWFGSRGCFKIVLAARAAATFAWAASTHGDRVGGLRFGSDIHESRPAGGRRGALRLFRLWSESQQPADASPFCTLATVSEELRRLVRPGALVILLSDFHDLDAPARQGLQVMARHCELVFGMVSDPLEREAPAAGIYPSRLGADAAIRLFNTRDRATRHSWQQQFNERQERARETAQGCRAHWLELCTEASVAEALHTYFGARRR